MNVVIAPAMPQQMAEHAQAKAQWRRDPPFALVIERHTRRDRDDANARQRGRIMIIPLPLRDIGDVMPLRGEPLRQRAIPALRPADRPGKQAIVDDADTHGLP